MPNRILLVTDDARVTTTYRRKIPVSERSTVANETWGGFARDRFNTLPCSRGGERGGGSRHHKGTFLSEHNPFFGRGVPHRGEVSGTSEAIVGVARRVLDALGKDGDGTCP